MVLFKAVRKLGKLLRGGASTRDLFLGVLLGTMIGFVPNISLTFILLIVVLLILNANIGCALIGTALGKGLCYALAPVTFELGFLIIHRIGLEPLFRFFAETPVLALMSLHVYCLTGGLIVGALLGAGFGWLLSRLILQLRKGLLTATERSERLQKLGRNFFVRALLRLVFGKQKKSMQEMMEEKPPLLRKWGIGLVVAAVLLLIGVDLLLLKMLLRPTLEKQLTAANGAEVNISEARLALLKGKLYLDGVQVTDSEKPTHNLVQAGRLEADLSIKQLLAKRFVIDLIEADDVRMDAKRESPGEVYVKPEPEERPEPEKDAIEKYIETAQRVKRYLEKVEKWMEKRKAEKKRREKDEKPAAERKEDLEKRARAEGYLNLSAKQLLAKRPTWVITLARVKPVRVTQDVPPMRVVAKELSSHPELHRKPMSVEVRAAETEETADGGVVVLRLYDPEEPNLLELRVTDVAIGKFVEMGESVPLNVAGGTATVVADGRFAAETLEIPFAITVKNLKAEAREGKSVLGMDPATAQKVFESLEHLDIQGILTGELSAPRVRVDMEKLAGSLKQALIDAGKAELARRADEQIQRGVQEIEKAVGKEATKEIEKLAPGAKEKVGELLPFGKKKDKDGDKKKEGEEKEEKKGLLDRFR